MEKEEYEHCYPGEDFEIICPKCGHSSLYLLSEGGELFCAECRLLMGN